MRWTCLWLCAPRLGPQPPPTNADAGYHARRAQSFTRPASIHSPSTAYRESPDCAQQSPIASLSPTTPAPTAHRFLYPSATLLSLGSGSAWPAYAHELSKEFSSQLVTHPHPTPLIGIHSLRYDHHTHRRLSSETLLGSRLGLGPRLYRPQPRDTVHCPRLRLRQQRLPHRTPHRRSHTSHVLPSRAP